MNLLPTTSKVEPVGTSWGLPTGARFRTRHMSLCHGASLHHCQSQSGVKWKHLSPRWRLRPVPLKKNKEKLRLELYHMAHVSVEGHSELLGVIVGVFTCNLDYQSLDQIRIIHPCNFYTCFLLHAGLLGSGGVFPSCHWATAELHPSLIMKRLWKCMKASWSDGSWCKQCSNNQRRWSLSPW